MILYCEGISLNTGFCAYLNVLAEGKLANLISNISLGEQ